MSRKPALAFIGSGNTAWNLGHAFQKAGYPITGIASRNAKTGKQLAKKLHTQFKDVTDLINEAAICFICVQDRYISDIVTSLSATTTVIVHCSGSAALEILGKKNKAGVFYPVISMRYGQEITFEGIPVCIESADKKVLAQLKALGTSLQARVTPMTSDKRRNLHLAAVYVNNFANACYIAAADILDKSNLDFKLLRPLLTETAVMASTSKPLDNQTGPARRKDKIILKKHLELLKSMPAHAKLYRALSSFIQKRYS